MLSIQYTFKGKKQDLDISSTASTEDLLRRISEQTLVPRTGLKVLFKGKVLRANEDESGPFLQRYPGIDIAGRLFVLGSSAEELAKIHSIDEHIQTRKNFRPPPATKRSQPVRNLGDDKYTFGAIQVLPQFHEQDKARAVLERLKRDKGILGIMKLHKWQVGSLIELSPAEKTILGYNRNKGELIALRLRTDDLEGFRHYDAVRKVLLHELAHNVWSEHDDNFHSLNRQLNKEVQQLDWTAQGGHKMSQSSFYTPAEDSGFHDDLEDVGQDLSSWQGGTYVLGGGSRASRGATSTDGQTLSTRDLVARAAQLRQIESEKDEDGMCGAQ